MTRGGATCCVVSRLDKGRRFMSEQELVGSRHSFWIQSYMSIDQRHSRLLDIIIDPDEPCVWLLEINVKFHGFSCYILNTRASSTRGISELELSRVSIYLTLFHLHVIEIQKGYSTDRVSLTTFTLCPNDLISDSSHISEIMRQLETDYTFRSDRVTCSITLFFKYDTFLDTSEKLIGNYNIFLSLEHQHRILLFHPQKCEESNPISYKFQCLCICGFIRMYVCVCVYVCLFVCTFRCMFACAYVSAYVCAKNKCIISFLET